MRAARAIAMVAMVMCLGLAACGGDDGDDGDDGEDVPTGTEASDAAAAGENRGDIVDPQPRGQALVSVDGQDYTLTEPGALACSLAEDSITFSFRIGDNEVTLGAGANEDDGQWFGSVDLRIANPSAEPGPIAYFPELPPESSGMTVDGDSFSYSGPMKKQPANDGSNPPPVDVGDGLITVTCP